MPNLKSACHLVVCLCCCTTLRAQHWVDFQWMGATVDGREFPKAAILLPVRIAGLKGNFVAQFDLGSDISQLYGNAVTGYFLNRSTLFQKLDTTRASTSDDGAREYPVIGLKANVGEYPVNDLYLADGFGDEIPKDSLYSSSPKIIGTIGASFTKNKVLIIDFPRNRLCLLDTMDRNWSSKASFVNGRMRKGRIQLPFTIHGKTSWIMFDTGASIFSLAVDSAFWSTIVDPNARQDTMHISSWGEIVPYYGAPAADIYLGDVKMPATEAWYTENKRLTEFNREEGISGLTGNTYFLNTIIVIDFRNKTFGVVRP